MGEAARFPIVLHQTFIEATRDTGYRSTGAAVAELIDNSIQARAKNIRVFVRDDLAAGDIVIGVMDDGSGMDGATLRRALQFGGSMRFGDRDGLGRFGMGLPNASVSQARRVDVYTWRSPNACIGSHLDVDDIAAGRIEEIPTVRRSAVPTWAQEHRNYSGTLVLWSRCDRLDNRRVSTVVRKLHELIGRMFRHFIWRGVKFRINDEPVVGIDPLFIQPGPLSGAQAFGEPLSFEVHVPDKAGTTSTVRVRFSELPVTKWHDMPVEEKRKHRIVDGAGLSIIRAGREVDYGWWFFGAKRRENYDSWWRGELSFEPALDEMFSITHSKQGINPNQKLRDILTPDMESIARQLNGRVQDAFAGLKASAPPVIIPLRPRPEPVISAKPAAKPNHKSSSPAKPEPAYTVVIERLGATRFFEARRADGKWLLVLNRDHPFYRKAYEPLRGDAGRKQLEAVLFAFAKTEAEHPVKRIDPRVFLAEWTDELAELLEGNA